MLLRACFVIMPEKELEFFEKSIFFSFFLWYDDKQDFYGTRAERQKKERSGCHEEQMDFSRGAGCHAHGADAGTVRLLFPLSRGALPESGALCGL